MNLEKTGSLVSILLLFFISCSQPKTSEKIKTSGEAKTAEVTKTADKSKTPEETKYSEETKYLENYLLKTVHLKFPENKEYFFIIPTNGCFGCRKSVLDFILSPDFNLNNCFAIISRPDDETEDLVKNRKNVFIDEKGKIDRLKLQVENTVMIITENKNIKNIIPITFQNSDSIRQLLKMF